MVEKLIALVAVIGMVVIAISMAVETWGEVRRMELQDRDSKSEIGEDDQ